MGVSKTDYCNVVRSTLKEIYGKGGWSVGYDSTYDEYVVYGPNDECEVLDGKKIRNARHSVKEFCGYIISIFGEPI